VTPIPQRSRLTVLICTLLVMNSAVLFAVAADAPFALAITALLLAFSLATPKPWPRTSRVYTYLGVGVGVLTVLGNQMFDINDERFIMLPVEIYGPGLLYFAACLTFFDERETTLTAILAASIVTLMISGNMMIGEEGNDAMPFSGGLLQNFAEFYMFTSVTGVILALWLLHHCHRRVMHRPEGAPASFRRRGWILASALLLILFSVGAREVVVRNEAAIRRFFYSFMGDFFRFRRGGYFGDRTNLWETSKLRADDFDRIVMRAVGKNAPGYLRARVYNTYENGQWKATDNKRQDLVEFMDDPDVAVINYRLPEVTPEAARAMRNNEFSVFLADDSIRRRLPVPGNFAGVAAVADTVSIDGDGTLSASDWEQSGGYTVERPETRLATAFNGPAPDTPEASEAYLQIPEELIEEFKAFQWSRQSPAVDNRRILPQGTAGSKRPQGSAGSKGELITDLVAYFNQNYTYELGTDLPDGDDPVLAFLQKGDRGHCELFAAATVLLLRSRGIPARYVVGFVCLEPAPDGDYWLARRGDAHAWAEAYVPELGGWTLVESTPASGVPDGTPRFSTIQAWIDRAMLAWQRFFAGVKRGYAAREIIRVLRGLVFGVWRVASHPVGGTIGILTLLANLAYFRYRRMLKAKRLGIPPELISMQKELEKIERRLARKTGKKRPASMTLDDFSASLEPEIDQEICEVRKFLENYARLRYSGAWKSVAGARSPLR
jgi:hypothetical protein